MKIANLLFLLGTCFSITANAQGIEAEMHRHAAEFRIEASKPYVYVEVDHIGPRTPLREGEPSDGIWLRLKNNCQVPIVIITLRASKVITERTIGVADEVVPTPQQTVGDYGLEKVFHQPGEEDFTDIFLSPNMNEAEVDAAIAEAHGSPNDVERKEAKFRPHGYNHGYHPGIQVLTVVPPGGEIPFSVPSNHVSKSWHFEIPFRFALKNEGPIRQPYSFVAFFWDDLPEAYRTGSTESPAPKSASPASTLLHESGHVDPPKPQ